MYFPYLRGKRFELLTLRESSDTIRSVGKIIPILEPVQSGVTELLKVAELYVNHSMPLVLVVNPDVGHLKAKHTDLLKALAENKKVMAAVTAGFLITSGTTISEVERFLTQFGSSPVAFIHWYNFSNPTALLSAMASSSNIAYQVFIESETGSNYRDSFSNYQRIIVRDGFRKRHRNIDYPDEEFFSEIHRTHPTLGFQGFGDFTIVGKDHSEKGGPTMPSRFTSRIADKMAIFGLDIFCPTKSQVPKTRLESSSKP